MGEKVREQPEEEKQKPERTSGLMRVAGVSEEKEKEVLADIKTEYFDKQDREELRKIEQEKTTEELEIINGILASMPDFVKKYGGVPVPVRPEHIHIVDSNKLTDKTKKLMGSTRGVYSSNWQGISVVIYPGENKITFAQRVTHELIHFNAFQSANFDASGQKISMGREGALLALKQGEKYEFYFHNINEAITEELAKRFDREYFKSIPAIAENVGYRSRFKMKDNPEDVANITKVGETNVSIERYKYIKERELLWKIIKEIQQKNPKRFKSEEDVFGAIAEAYFTGKMLGIAKLVERTFGKGSLRDLGKHTKFSEMENKE